MLTSLLENAPLLWYLGIAGALILTGCGLPIPEEGFIILAGIAAASGSVDPWGALAACLIGALIGDCVMYAIGYHFGHNLLRDHPRLTRFLRPEREARIERMIAMHGWKVLFMARFLVGLRSPVYLTAGILRMPFRRYLAIDAVCAAIVVSTFFGLSYLFADRVQAWWTKMQHAEVALTVAIVLGVAGVGLFFFLRHRRRLERIRVRKELRSLRLRASERTPETNSAG